MNTSQNQPPLLLLELLLKCRCAYDRRKRCVYTTHAHAHKQNFAYTYLYVCMRVCTMYILHSYIHALTHSQNFKSFRFVYLILSKFIHFFPFGGSDDGSFWRYTHNSWYRIACIFILYNLHFLFFVSMMITITICTRIRYDIFHPFHKWTTVMIIMPRIMHSWVNNNNNFNFNQLK